MDKAASITDSLGCVGPDGASGDEAVAGSSPATATAAVATAGGVEAVSAPNRERSLDRLEHSHSERRNLRGSRHCEGESE